MKYRKQGEEGEGRRTIKNMIRRRRKRKLQQQKVTLKATQKRNMQHWKKKMNNTANRKGGAKLERK